MFTFLADNCPVVVPLLRPKKEIMLITCMFVAFFLFTLQLRAITFSLQAGLSGDVASGNDIHCVPTVRLVLFILHFGRPLMYVSPPVRVGPLPTLRMITVCPLLCLLLPRSPRCSLTTCIPIRSCLVLVLPSHHPLKAASHLVINVLSMSLLRTIALCLLM